LTKAYIVDWLLMQHIQQFCGEKSKLPYEMKTN